MPRLVLILLLILLSAVSLRSHAQDTPSPREYRVLMVGNSITYTNNLPALLRAVGASQGTTITTETYAAPNGKLAERWHEGHVADALRTRKFDVVVLQEMGGKLAGCMATSEQRMAPCAASLRAYSGIAGLAKAAGARTLVFTTWSPDTRSQSRLSRSARMIADQSSSETFNAAGVLKALRQAEPEENLLPDGMHPSTRASLMLALALYRDITGSTPAAKDLEITAPLLPMDTAVSPSTPMELQPELRGNGKVTVVPASLLEPLIRALPAPTSVEMNPSSRGR